MSLPSSHDAGAARAAAAPLLSRLAAADAAAADAAPATAAIDAKLAALAAGVPLAAAAAGAAGAAARADCPGLTLTAAAPGGGATPAVARMTTRLPPDWSVALVWSRRKGGRGGRSAAARGSSLHTTLPRREAAPLAFVVPEGGCGDDDTQQPPLVAVEVAPPDALTRAACAHPATTPPAPSAATMRALVPEVAPDTTPSAVLTALLDGAGAAPAPERAGGPARPAGDAPSIRLTLPCGSTVTLAVVARPVSDGAALAVEATATGAPRAVAAAAHALRARTRRLRVALGGRQAAARPPSTLPPLAAASPAALEAALAALRGARGGVVALCDAAVESGGQNDADVATALAHAHAAVRAATGVVPVCYP